MVYRTSPGKPPGEFPAIALQQVCPAFPPGVLVSPYYHGVFILPYVKYALVRFHPFQQVFLHRKVPPRVL